MQDGDDEVRRSRRTRRRPDGADPPASPAPQGPPGPHVPPPGAHPSGPQRRPGAHPSGPQPSGAQPPATQPPAAQPSGAQPRPGSGPHPSGPQPRPATGPHPSQPQQRPADAPPGPVPPTGVRRVRGGPVPRRPGEPPAPQRPRPRDGAAPAPSRATPVPPPGGVSRPPSPIAPGGTDARPVRTPAEAPETARPATPVTGTGPGTRATPAAAARPGSGSESAAGSSGGPAADAGRSGAGAPPPARLDPRARALRIGAAAAAVLVLVTTAFGFAGRSEVHAGVRDVVALAPDTDAILDADIQADDQNVLVLGLQADRASTAESARTDTAVLVHRPAGGGPAVTLSIPATLEVSRPPCRRFDAATGTYGDTVPAESRTAFATAYDVGGPACSVGVVQQLTGMPVRGFVALDLAGTPELVDAVGGIEVCTERPVVDPVLGPVVEGSGTVELDGATAVRFASAAGTADSSPANRVRRQQRVLAAALGDALSTTSLLTPGAPGRSAAGVSSALSADGVDAGEILTLARGLARSGAAGDGEAPLFLSIPVSDAPNTRGQLELRRSEARALFSALREHGPLPESATAPASRSAGAPGPGTVVNLVDATGRPGAVDRIAADLRDRGYEIGSVTPGTAAPGAQVRYSPDNTDAAGTLVEALPGARPVPDPTASRVLELVVGAGDAAPVQAVPSDDADCD